MQKLKKVAFISGGASGIGLAFAGRWIHEGGYAVIADSNASAITAAVSHFGSEKTRGIVCDVSSTTSVNDAFADLKNAEGRLDVVLCAAGNARPEVSAKMTDESFASLLDIHVSGTMRVCRAAYPLLQCSGGAIVNVASVAALTGMPHRASYTAAKAAICGLSRTLAVEWGPRGVRVNTVAPGYVRTPLTDQLIENGALNDTKIKTRTSLGRFAEPAEIASAIYFLSSSDASFVNGHLLIVDGGLSVDGNWY